MRSEPTDELPQWRGSPGRRAARRRRGLRDQLRDRWRPTGTRLLSAWRNIEALDKARIVALVAAVVLLLGVLPWRGGSFHPRLFINGLILLAAVATYSLIYLYPAHARRYSGEIAFGAAVVTYLLTPDSTTQREFYSAAAQVVPVLFLALAIEQRAFEVRAEMDESTRRFLTLPAAGLFIAGAEAFHALLGRPEKASLQLVMSGLVLGAVALFIRAVAGRRIR